MPETFADRILDWYRQHGRHDLPWQQPRSPYRVWISEIMLQQTRVTTVIPYFLRFMEHYPDVKSLADAEPDHVLHLWTGLGYYARARNLHRTARLIRDEYDGGFPRSVEELSRLPGIGRSTAGAIVSLGMGQRAVILDGNVKRVLCRYHAVPGWPGRSAVNRRLWTLAEELTPSTGVADYNQAMMDLGATVCTRSQPDCEACPLSGHCRARRDGTVAEYPQRKPKKDKPVRTAYMLLCSDGENRVLLHKRPPTGVWGGLWSLPECDDQQQIREFCRRRGGRRIGEWPALRHTFSHFHLDITPVRIRIGEDAGGVTEAEENLWYPTDHSLAVGLAAPVKKLLERFAANPESETETDKEPES